MKTVLGITGIRSEYDIVSSVFRAIEEHSELELQVLATGAHLSEAYGHTLDQIRADGFTLADEVLSLLNSDRPEARAKGLGVQLAGMVQTVVRIAPDFLLVLGDREEAIATAIIGNYMNIPVAHISGGDRVVGNADDQVRHAVSKLAHLHFVTNAESEERLLKMGEQAFRVMNFGNPGIDRLLSTPEIADDELAKRLGVKLPAAGEPLVLLIQHPLSSEVEQAYAQMNATLRALEELDVPTVATYPNSDAGSRQIIRALEEFAARPFLTVFKNLPRLEFVNLMRRVRCMVGNSSAGLLEAPSLGLPVVNVGNRQSARLHAANVAFVPHEVAAIKAATHKALFDDVYRTEVARAENPYGDGRTSARIADVLANIEIDDRLLIKEITY